MTNKPVKDVFGLWQIKGAELSGKYEIPIIHGTSKIPDSLIPFTKCEKEKYTETKSIHFFQLDENFLSCLESKNKLTKKLETLRKFQSVISPDYSIYRDMPFAQQIYQVYKSRAVSNFLMQNGIKIIPNIRWGDEHTYDFVFEGIDKWGVVAVGVQGAYRNKENTKYFEQGFYKMINKLEPETILCYGNLSNALKAECEYRKIIIKQYPTEISKVNKDYTSSQQELELFE